MANQTTVTLTLTDAVLKRGTPNPTVLPAATLVDTCGDVDLKITMDEAPANNRKTPIKQQLPSLAGVELEVSFPSDSADAHLAAFRTAFINRQPIPIYVSDQSAMIGFGGIMGVFGWQDPQPLAGVPDNKFTLKPWAVGASGTQPAFS